jgi:hypothetical protein
LPSWRWSRSTEPSSHLRWPRSTSSSVQQSVC